MVLLYSRPLNEKIKSTCLNGILIPTHSPCTPGDRGQGRIQRTKNIPKHSNWQQVVQRLGAEFNETNAAAEGLKTVAGTADSIIPLLAHFRAETDSLKPSSPLLFPSLPALRLPLSFYPSFPGFDLSNPIMDYSYFAPSTQPYQFFGIAPAKPELSYTPQEEPQNEPLVSSKLPTRQFLYSCFRLSAYLF